MSVLATPYLSDPSGPSPLLGAVAWIEGTLLGTVATIIAVICVATVGLLMFSGRIDVRRGLTVVLGCFVLFGSAAIVQGFRGVPGGGRVARVGRNAVPPPVPPSPTPSATYDPYAGAAVIRR